ncbi:hypothetical protein [Nonomuraea sp. NPDC049400]
MKVITIEEHFATAVLHDVGHPCTPNAPARAGRLLGLGGVWCLAIRT